MGNRGLTLPLLKPKGAFFLLEKHRVLFSSTAWQLFNYRRKDFNIGRLFSTKPTSNGSSLQPPDIAHLAETARISLTPQEAEEIAPKIRQVIDWFGQLQSVSLNSVEPAIRADTEGDSLREDIPEIFEDRDTMMAAVPSNEESYIKVPKVLNKE
uniref:Glutamyl-tRNA(Gln) amidotransferase subunit C, chloroplastic/mitochondrial n=2 Tax=Rhizophora mucronata TaxID=61149 RepID=A0A2P2K1Y4_RHIMU